MLYRFLRDMWAALRLRYTTLDNYHYTFPVTLAVLLLTGLVNAAATPIFGKTHAAIVFIILLTILKYTILSIVMDSILLRNTSPKHSFWGFVLVSETLSVPLLAAIYVPSLATLGLFWQVWIFVLQATGFIKISGKPLRQVILGYAVYTILTALAGYALLLVFAQQDLLDLNLITEQIETMLQTR